MSAVNDVLPIALYKKLQKQLEPIVEKLNHLEHTTNIIEAKEGARGATGNPGEAGLQGARGLQGQTGAQGIQGQTGKQGERGEQGKQGQTGAQGIQGERGSEGEQGIQGERGEQGQTGEQGIQGRAAIDGQTGAQGIQGERGSEGEQGIQGEHGSKGEQGIQGIQGERGEQGIQGERGEQGIQGERGLEGQTGERGEQGIQGIQGIQGALGEQGERGLEGQTGERGEQGIQGERGEQGIQGEIGPSGKDAIIPDIDSIIEPFITKTQTHIDGYIDKSEKTFKSWQSIVNSQLSSVGGGGEVWLRHLNDVDRTTTRVDGAFLKYNAATKKWVGDASISSGITLTGYSSAAGVISSADSIVSAVSKLNGNTALKAPINNPTFTGIPAVPTAASSDSSTTIASTAFVKAQGYLTSAPVSSVASRTGAVTLVSADITDATSVATPNTLVLRDETGGASFAAVGAASVSSDGDIKTSGEEATIWTEGSGGHIYTIGGYIQTGYTFNLNNGTYTTTLSHSPTANRAIAFPDESGTVATQNFALAMAIALG